MKTVQNGGSFAMHKQVTLYAYKLNANVMATYLNCRICVAARCTCLPYVQALKIIVLVMVWYNLQCTIGDSSALNYKRSTLY